MKRSHYSSSNVKVAKTSITLHLDIISEILSRLPVKSLLRFKSVCKTWYILIKSPNFVTEHLKQSNSSCRNALIVTYQDYGWDFVYLHEIYLQRTVSIGFVFKSVVGVCNGLVCFSMDSFIRFTLVNPATCQSHKIPKCKWRDSAMNTIEYVKVGFGFHPEADDYKLIRYVRYKALENEKYICHAEVYSWSRDSWKDIEVPSSVALLYVVATPGKFFWEAHDLQNSKRKVVSFDMGDEMFRVIKSPLVIGDATYHKLIELKGELALVALSHERCFNVWVLDEHESGWSEKYKFGPMPIMRSPRERVGNDNDSITVVGSSANGIIVVENLSGEGDTELLLCDPGSREIKGIPYFDSVDYSLESMGSSGP